jgi:energy-coupling factor transporter ATP-binding protein EcfA2
MTSPAVEPLLSLDDSELEWKRFERFCLDLARALPDVVDAHLYGVQGDDQEGIDIHADLADGRVRSIQCRRVGKFGKPELDKTIADTTYRADEYRIWTTCKLTAPSRRVLKRERKWDAWDIEELSSTVRGLPREVGRWIVEDHLGAPERRRVLGPDAALALAPASAWFARNDTRRWSLRTDQPLAGRADELAALCDAVLDGDCVCVLLVGRGGSGKSRLLRALADGMPARRMLAARNGVEAQASMGDELPLAKFDLLIDDAHRRADLSTVLASVLARDELGTLILATRPHAVEQLRAELADRGLPAHAVRVLEPLEPLATDAAQALAAHELDDDKQGAAPLLAAQLRDVPALLVLAARAVNRGDLNARAPIAAASFREEILTRYREERLGRVSDTVAPDVAADVLSLAAAIEPIAADAPFLSGWLAARSGHDETAVKDAVRALIGADLLAGPPRALRVAPDIFGDHLLLTRCAADNGTGVRELMELVPLDLLGQLMVNLAQLEWRLTRADASSVLDFALEELARKLVELAAWPRERHLEQLVDAAPLLAGWVVSLARRLIDNPAKSSELFAQHQSHDADARRPLAQMLARAAVDPDHTETAIRLLWEIGADAEPQPSRSGGDPLDAARRAGSYELPLSYAETLFKVAAELSCADDAEVHRHLPLALLEGLVRREGTTARQTDARAIQLGSYVVNADATEPLRARMRALLVEQAVSGGERMRVRAAELLGDMLRQPHGYYGQAVPQSALKQWRSEQRALVADLERVLERSDDPLVARAIRHAAEWHADHSTLGVKTAVRNALRQHPPSSDELLSDALTFSLARFAKFADAEARRADLVSTLRAESGDIGSLLDRIDAILDRLARTRAAETADPGPLLAALALDADAALQAARLLVAEPDRPSGRALGLLLSNATAGEPDEVATLVAELGRSPDVLLRRQAGAHVAQMRWFDTPNSPERALAVELAGDDDLVVVRHAVRAALRAADADPSLAAAILLAVRDLGPPQLAEEACMVLTHPLGLSNDDWERILERLLACPEVDHWYDAALVMRAADAPQQVFDHLLARVDAGSADYAYRPLPFDGMSGDLLASKTTLRRGALKQVAKRLEANSDGLRPQELSALFWSLAAGNRCALDVLADALAGDDRPHQTACLLAAEAPRSTFVSHPDWVRDRLEASAAGAALAELQGAMAGSLQSGSKQGVAGQPFPEDVELHRVATAHASAARAGSRARDFWDKIVAAAQREIERAQREP